MDSGFRRNDGWGRNEGRGDAAGVHAEDDALVAKEGGGITDEFGVLDGGGVDADLVRAGVEHCADVLDGADAAADGEGDVDFLGDAADDIEHDGAAVRGGGDVVEDELVRALFIVEAGEFDGIAGVAVVPESDALDDAAAFDIEAGDDSTREHGASILRGGGWERVGAAVGFALRGLGSRFRGNDGRGWRE